MENTHDVFYKDKVIKSNDDCTITVSTNKDMPFLNFAIIENDTFCLAMDLSSITFGVCRDKNLAYDSTYSLSDNDIIKYMEDFLKYNKDKYEECVLEDNPSSAFVLTDKRVLAKQYYKALSKGDFSDMALYDWGLDIFSSLENGYGYEVIFLALETFHWKHRDIIVKRISDALEGQVDCNGDITIYRGFNGKSRVDGVSFTTKIEVAEFFANRWKNYTDTKGYVKKYKVNINDIIGYIDNGESEVITNKAREIE